MFLHLVYGLLFFGNVASESLEARALVRAEAYFADKMAQEGEDVQTEGLVRTSPHAVHVYFTRNYRGMPVWDKVPRAVHFDHSLSKVLTSSQAKPLLRLPNFGILSENKLAALISAESGRAEIEYRLSKQSRLLIVDQANVYPALRLDLLGPEVNQRLLVDVDSQTGMVLNRFNPLLNGRAEGRGRIWRHNPIAASQDASGPDSRLVEVPLRGLDGSGYLRGDYVDVTYYQPEWVNPQTTSRWTLTYSPGAALESDFVYLYDPDDARFEEVSAYYWMDRAQRYLQARDHQLVDRPMQVNVHQFAGSNAFYDLLSKTIAFGDGFIDTAEDGDVVRHEYGHAVLDDFAGYRFYNYYGAMFHEGFADFFSYLVGQDAEEEVGPDRYPDFMGEWFGSFNQTDPPYLRTLHTPSFDFPFLSYQPHRDGQLWSSAFYELAATLGKERSAEIVLESIYFTESGDPRHVSAALLMAENLISGGENAESLKNILRERGLFETEQNTEFLNLSVDQSVVLESAEQAQFIRFQAPDVSDLRINFTPDGPSPGYIALLQKDQLATEAHFQKQHYDENQHAWTLSTSGTSYPLLEAGAYYYLYIYNFSGLLQVSLEATDPVPGPPDLPFSTTQSVRYDEQQSYRISGLSGYKKLAIHFDMDTYGDEILLLSATRPYSMDDWWPELILTATLDPSSNPLFANLEQYFPNVDELFLTCDTWFGSEGPGTIRLEPHQEANFPELTLGQPLEVTLDVAGTNFYQLNLDQTSESLVFQSDESHPFTVRSAATGYPVHSVLEQGVHTLILDSGQWPFLGDTGRVYAEPGQPNIAGIYTLELMGTVGSLACLSVYEGSAEAGTQLSNGQTVQLELAPRELIRYRFSLPEDAYDIQAILLNTTPSTFIELAIYNREIAPSQVKSSWEKVLTGNYPYYRLVDEDVDLPERSVYEPHFTPGATYELLLHNPRDFFPQTIEFQLVISTEPEPVETLTDGMVISFPSQGPDFLFWGDSYRKIFQVDPPAGTQRVQIEFEHLTGPKQLSFYLWDAALKGRGYLAYDLHLDRNDLRHLPDQPFLIYGIYNFPSGSIDPSTRVKLTYHSDGPQNAILDPQHDRLVSGLASIENFPTELTIPPDTERVDLAWFAPEYALDVPVYFLADLGTELPLDLAPLRDMLEYGDQRRDFHLQAKSAFEAMSEEHWVITQQMLPSYNHNAGWQNEQPFPFELGVRYRPIAAQGTICIPQDIDGEQVSTASLRLVNPGSVAVQFTLDTGSVDSYTLQAGAFLDLAPQPGQELKINADGALLSMIGLEGSGWLTTASGVVQRQDRLLLPHISPDASDWASYLQVTSNGTTSVAHTPPSGSMPQPSLGPEPEVLVNPNPLASWSLLGTSLDERGLFREVALSAAQFWRNGSQVAAEQPLPQGSRTLYVPHLPDNPDWWSALTLSNTGEAEAEVTVRAYGPSGPSIRSHQFKLGAGETRVDLMGTYLADGLDTTSYSWLRLDSSQPLLALEFMGGIHSGDTAGFSLPQRGGLDLVLPGNLHSGVWGVAVINSVAQAGTARLDAVGLDGLTLASQTLTLAAFERRLLTGADFAVANGVPYILRLTTADLSLAAFQLDLDDTDRRAASAAVLIH